MLPGVLDPLWPIKDAGVEFVFQPRFNAMLRVATNLVGFDPSLFKKYFSNLAKREAFCPEVELSLYELHNTRVRIGYDYRATFSDASVLALWLLVDVPKRGMVARIPAILRLPQHHIFHLLR
ncbi:hypothetical protein WDW37_11915 [Bdellovibrionota bacterium FG-1]